MRYNTFCAVLILLVFNAKAQPKVDLPAYLDDSKPIAERVEHALSLMTLAEKVAVTHAQSLFSVKGVPRLGIPELRMTDGPHGIRSEIAWGVYKDVGWTTDSCTAFPNLTCLAATWNPQIAYLYGTAIGVEARYREKNVLLGPGVNIIRTPLNGRNFEYLSEDPFLTSQMAVSYIKGVQENGVAACVKHYTLNNQETWRDFINVKVSERALHEIYLPAFKSSIQEGGALSVMASYNKFKGLWVAQNGLLLKKILKEDWKFKGAVISDWNAVHNTLDAAGSGLDIEMGTKPGKGKSFDDYYFAKPYLTALQAGNASIKDLDDKVRRFLYLTFNTSMNRNKPFGSFGTQEHANAARTIATQGIVLLKNVNSLLPLIPEKVKSIAVIGENATRSMTVGGGSSTLKVNKEVSPLNGLIDRFGKTAHVRYVQGYSHEETKGNLISEAVSAARDAEIVLFIGGLSKDKGQDAESADRKEYQLPFNQNDLIDSLLKVNKNVIVILISGTAVEMPWADRVPSIVQAWYGGAEAGNAIADIISGDVNPSGKLPFTINRKLQDYAAHSVGEFPGDSVNVAYKEGVYVGYRWNDAQKIKPLFSFGHGLSYTSFSYGKASGNKKVLSSGDTLVIKIPVRNKGAHKGEEVVQLYIHDINASVERPYKELKLFKKIGLLPGEEKVVEFVISKKELQFYSEKKADWTVETGDFKALIGSSSTDIRSVFRFKFK